MVRYAQNRRKSGLTKVFAKLIRPLTRVLFPRLDKNSPALAAISMNMLANILGLANAATPLGLKAMNELDRINPKRHGKRRNVYVCCAQHRVNPAYSVDAYCNPLVARLAKSVRNYRSRVDNLRNNRVLRLCADKCVCKRRQEAVMSRISSMCVPMMLILFVGYALYKK
ncbi:MAG: hypothetical protein L6V93_10865 [Clostridiales bacterium]|nr:MAG: hypothetical protein L6V93_10865 [Clostridiales bacterium]